MKQVNTIQSYIVLETSSSMLSIILPVKQQRLACKLQYLPPIDHFSPLTSYPESYIIYGQILVEITLNTNMPHFDFHKRINMDMLIEQENLLMLMDERVTCDQWQFANLGLSRQISSENSIWDILLETPPITAPISTKSDSLSSTQGHMEDSSQESDNTTHHSVNEQRPISTKGSDSNYEKNICAYITKKAVQCFIQATYRRKVQRLCVKYGCDYNKAMEYYGKRYKEVFGITLLTLLISPEDESEVAMKEVFTVFLRWFLREKYMLYLMKNGKMSEKEKYVQFKNKYLLYISKSEEKLRLC